MGNRRLLDDFDRHLLRIVQRDAHRTSEVLASEVGLSASAVQRRLARLRKTGVISRTIAVLDPMRVTRTTLFIVSLVVERERPQLLAQLRRWLAHEESVQQVYYVTGGADFILILAAQDVRSFDAFMTRLVAENQNVIKFNTNVVLSAEKVGIEIPVPKETVGGETLEIHVHSP